MAFDQVIVHTQQVQSDIHVVYINGNIICNLSGTPVREAVEQILRSKKPRIILNIRDVRYLDSFSFGWLIKVHKTAKQKGGIFTLSNPNKDIADLIEMMGFSKELPVFNTEEEALRSLAKREPTPGSPA